MSVLGILNELHKDKPEVYLFWNEILPRLQVIFCIKNSILDKQHEIWEAALTYPSQKSLTLVCVYICREEKSHQQSEIAKFIHLHLASSGTVKFQNTENISELGLTILEPVNLWEHLPPVK